MRVTSQRRVAGYDGRVGDANPVGREMSLEEWADLEEDDPRELVDGRLEEAEMPTWAHELVASWLVHTLRAWLVPRGGAVVAAGYKFAVAARTGRIPDVSAWFPGTPKPRLDQSMSRTPPDLAVEIISTEPRDVRRDRIAKHREYAKFGLRSYWMIDPMARTLEVLSLHADGRYALVLSESAGAHDVPGCEGLRVDLDALWTELDAAAGSGSDE
jgi:Uma2 family endonuclease